MKRVSVITIGAALVYVVCTLLATSKLAAEPILGDEGLGSSDTTIQRAETVDAMALFKAHDYEGALKAWKEAAQKNVDLPPAQVIMTYLFRQANMPKEAKNALEQAANDDPNDPEVYLLMADAAMRERDASKAEAMLKKANDLLPGFTKSDKRKKTLQPQIMAGMAGVAETRGDWAGAQRALEELLKLDPKNAMAMQRVAYCLVRQRDPQAALAKLRAAARLNANMPAPEAVLAQLYQRAGDRENVNKWMAAAVEAAPKDIKTRLAAGYDALEMGQMADAQKHAIAAARIDSKSPDAKFLRGLIALCQKDYSAGELFFDALAQKSPDDFAASNNLAMSLIEQDDEAKTKRALQYAEMNAEKFPKSASAASTLGWVYYRVGRLDDAEKWLRKAATLGKVSIDTAYFTARLDVARGRKAEAVKLLEDTLKESRGLSMFRHESEELLKELKK
jgi:tetratricopeptide (TPR) repeat protein